MLPALLLAAAMSLNIGMTVNDAKTSFFVTDGSYSNDNLPSTWSSSDQFSNSNTIALQARLWVDLMSLIGYVAIYRSIIILARLGSPSGAGNSSFGKFVAFFIGGTILQAPGEVAAGVGTIIPFFTSLAQFLNQAV